MEVRSIIQRRDLDPLWQKANEVVRNYEKATDCITAVIGADCVEAEHSKHPKALLFCSLCKRYGKSDFDMKSWEYPCTPMHLKAVINARKAGGSIIYTCPVGFFYWASSFFAGERFAGAFISSVMPSTEKQKILDRIFNLCKKEISRAEISAYLDDVPEKSDEEVKTLARMMSICADHLSCSCSGSGAADERQTWNYQPDIMDKERQLISYLHRGDSTDTDKIVWNLLNDLQASSGDNFEIFKFKVIELVVVLSRAGTDPANNEELIESTNRYLKRLEDLTTFDEIYENLCVIIKMLSGKLFSFKGIRHASALRKAERFIRENFTRKISLKEIAAVSELSAPYFSTIFKDEMGENLSNYLNRIRIEKASSMLRETDLPVCEISGACGFEDQSWFSKIFKAYNGISPCRYRELGGLVTADQNIIERQVYKNHE